MVGHAFEVNDLQIITAQQAFERGNIKTLGQISYPVYQQGDLFKYLSLNALFVKSLKTRNPAYRQANSAIKRPDREVTLLLRCVRRMRLRRSGVSEMISISNRRERVTESIILEM